MTEHSSGAESAASRLHQMLMAGRLAQAVSVAASLRVPDLLAGGARSSDDLAAATATDPDSLYRLLRAIAAAGVLEEDHDRRFRLTDLGDLLRSDHEASLLPVALNAPRAQYQAAWANLEHSIRTGENAFGSIYGEDVWKWRSSRPLENAIFNRAMVAQTASVGPRLAEAYDFAGVRTVVDVGGGSGSLLAAILAAHPAVRGILFDQPHVTDEPATRELLDGAGVLDRCEIVGGDFFERVPAAADIYLLKAILHDWEDDDATRILRTIRAAAPLSSRLLVVEAVVGLPNQDLATKLADLNMLVIPGGRERTEAEWRDLFDAGGFELVEIRPLTRPWNIIVGDPVAGPNLREDGSAARGRRRV